MKTIETVRAEVERQRDVIQEASTGTLAEIALIKAFDYVLRLIDEDDE